jgi:gamma-glutamylputrescine oxidase
MPPPFAAATHNYYQATALPAPVHPVLQGDITADVCVIGGGVSGCSTALHLARRGYRVVLLEAQQIGFGASGRSGGQLLPGYSSGQAPLKSQLGASVARQLWDLSVEAVQLTQQLIAEHQIDCDLQQGHLDVAVTPRRARELQQYQQALAEHYDYPMQLLNRADLREWLTTDRYAAGLYDSRAPHAHPLNYTLGLAAAATRAGVTIHEHTQALDISGQQTLRIRTAQGTVTAQHAVLCCNAYVGNLSRTLDQRIMPVGTYIVATEPLGEARITSLIPRNVSVADTNFILDYFRRSADHRLLFGGRVSYSGRDFGNTTIATRKRIQLGRHARHHLESRPGLWSRTKQYLLPARLFRSRHGIGGLCRQTGCRDYRRSD